MATRILSLAVVMVLALAVSVFAEEYDPPVREAVSILRSEGFVKGFPVVRVVGLEEVSHLPLKAGAHYRGFQVMVDGIPDPTIYIVRSDTAYRLAARGNSLAILFLAGTILHEQTHVQGGDEKAAMKAEIKFLRGWIGRLPLDLWQAVMKYVLDLEKQMNLD